MLVKIPNILDGMGRSDLLPRQTREHRLHLAETVSLEGSRNSWKFGGDGLLTWIYDFFPSQQSGEYLFYPIKVDPFTFRAHGGRAGAHVRCALTPTRFRTIICRISAAPLHIRTRTNMRPSRKTRSA